MSSRNQTEEISQSVNRLSSALGEVNTGTMKRCVGTVQRLEREDKGLETDGALVVELHPIPLRMLTK